MLGRRRLLLGYRCAGRLTAIGRQHMNHPQDVQRTHSTQHAAPSTLHLENLSQHSCSVHLIVEPKQHCVITGCYIQSPACSRAQTACTSAWRLAARAAYSWSSARPCHTEPQATTPPNPVTTLPQSQRMSLLCTAVVRARHGPCSSGRASPARKRSLLGSMGRAAPPMMRRDVNRRQSCTPVARSTHTPELKPPVRTAHPSLVDRSNKRSILNRSHGTDRTAKPHRAAPLSAGYRSVPASQKITLTASTSS